MPECNISCPNNDDNTKNNNGKCDYSCHSRTCQCGSCHHGHPGQCGNPDHEYWCHCGDEGKPVIRPSSGNPLSF